VPGQDGVKIEEIVDGLVLYMHSDALTKGLPGGKRWLKIDLKAAAGKQGVDITQLQSLSGGGDPTQFLTYLAEAGDVREVGSEDVNGTPTTHYHATIDFEKLAGSAGKAADSVRQLEQVSGLKKLPTDIWIDAAQRVRRQTVAIDVKQPLPIKFSLQIDYKRFGVPVDVQAPPAAETVDYSAVAGGG
jgi:archaellin